MPSVTQICYYVEVAKCLSFSRASQNLYITQPTLNRQMTALEKELNMQLFIRSSRGLKLTPAGLILYREFEDLAERYQTAVKKAGYASRGYNDTLYIGIVNGIFIENFISETVSYFREEYPNIQMILQRCDFDELLEKFEKTELDIIISFDYHLADLKNVKKGSLISYRPVWAVPKINPLSEKETICFRDMVNEEILVVQNDGENSGLENIAGFCETYGGFHPNFFGVKNMDNLFMWLETSDKCAFLNSRIRVSDRVKLFPVQELQSRDSFLEYAWKEKRKKFSLDLLIDYFRKRKKNSRM